MNKIKNETGLARLFITFFKLGAITFGGGYAMIPMMHKEFVVNRGWITNEEMSEMIAIAESTPGSLSVNAATFIGRRVRGIPGAFFSTLGVVLPSFGIILVLSRFLGIFSDNIYLKYTFFGLRAGVLALIIKALIIMARQAPHNAFSYCLIAGAFVADTVFGINTIIVIGVCCALGIASTFIQSRLKGIDGK